jgi:hypothetical protein
MADENPYQPPSGACTPEAPGVVRIGRPQKGIPATVIVVIVLVSLYMLFALFGAVSNPLGALVQLGIASLILVGIVRGNALAWQWGMVIPVLNLVILLVSVAMSLAAGVDTVFLAIIFAMAAANLAIPVLLAVRNSRVFFGLQCPKCGAFKTKAKDFVFSKRQCKLCKTQWVR